MPLMVFDLGLAMNAPYRLIEGYCSQCRSEIAFDELPWRVQVPGHLSVPLCSSVCVVAFVRVREST